MPLADADVPGDGGDIDVGVGIVRGDVVQGLEHILALVALGQQQGVLRRLGSALLFPYAGDGGHQILIPEGLEQVVRRAVAQGGAGIVELVVGGENDEVGGAVPLTEAAHHLDAVHAGHPHIGDDEAGVVALCGGETLLAVGGLSHHHAVHGGPVHAQHDAAAHHRLVVNDQYLQHGLLLSSWAGAV